MLIEAMMSPCVIMKKNTTSDGEGGRSTTWEEGDSILVAITYNSSMNARRAEKEGVTSVYKLTTTKANRLGYHDVIKRVSDGRYFRVTSEKDDVISPDLASLDIAQVDGERWELTV